MEVYGPQNCESSEIFVGQEESYEFSLSQKDVVDFVALSGDSNVIHQDREAALQSPIGEEAVPGMLTALIFTRILGTIFPGHGTVYYSQLLKFSRAAKTDRRYVVKFRVLGIVQPAVDPDRPEHIPLPRATIATNVFDPNQIDSRTGGAAVLLRGEAVVLNKLRIKAPV